MTFSAARSATGAIIRRKLEFGAAIPVMETFNCSHDSSNSFTVTKPSGTIDGDFLLLHSVHYTNQVLNQVTGGWTALWQHILTDGSRSTSHHGFYRVVQLGDTTWDFLFDSGGNRHQLLTYRISGVDQVNPVAGWNSIGRTGGSSTLILPAALSGRTNCLLMHCLGRSDVFGGGIIVPPGDDEVTIHEDGVTNLEHFGAREDFASGGGTGTRTYTAGSTDSKAGALVLIQPSEIIPSALLLENGTDKLLFEDSSGVLLLED